MSSSSSARLLPFCPRPSVLAIHLAWCGMLALAQPVHAAGADTAPATRSARTSYDIAAGPLNAVLARFMTRSGVFVAVDGALTAGRASPGVQGTLAPVDALTRLLAGSGLQAVANADGSFILRQTAPEAPAARPAAATTATLPSVLVRGDRARTLGDVDGFVARRSTAATKIPGLLIESPQSVSVITAEELASRKAETLDEALRYTAGVTPNMKPWAVDEFSMLRGFDLGAAGIFRDGLLTSGRAYAAPIEPYGLERLEVLRGPASVLYGQSPPGGMVNAVSKRPSAKTLREVGVAYGSYDRKQLKADVGGALDERGEWTWRLTMLARDGGTRLDLDRDKRTYVAPALTWQPAPDTRLTLLANYQKDDQSYAWPNQLVRSGPAGQPDPRVNLGGHDNRWKRENHSFGYDAEHRFNSVWSIQHNLRYTRLERDETNVFPRVLLADGRSVTRLFYPRNSAWRGLQADTRLQADFATGAVAHTMLAGLDYSDNKTTDGYPYSITPMPNMDLYAPVYGGHEAIVDAPAPRIELYPLEQIGLYLQDQIKWDRWVVTAGLRRDRARNANTRELPAQGTSTLAYRQAASKTTGRLGAVYLFDDGWAPYVSYATSFSPEIGRDIAGELLKPSTGRQFEAGLRYQPLDASTVYTASAFHLTRQNVRTTAPQDPGATVQTGEVTSRGVEFEARTQLMRNISLVAQYTFLDTEIARSNNGDRGLGQPGAVRHSVSAWTRYSFRLGASLLADAALGLRYSGKARSYQDYGADDITNPSFGMVDAAFGIDHGAWRFSVNVNNLLDRQVLFDCDTNFCYRSAERTVNASASYRF